MAHWVIQQERDYLVMRFTGTRGDFRVAFFPAKYRDYSTGRTPIFGGENETIILATFEKWEKNTVFCASVTNQQQEGITGLHFGHVAKTLSILGQIIRCLYSGSHALLEGKR